MNGNAGSVGTAQTKQIRCRVSLEGGNAPHNSILPECTKNGKADLYEVKIPEDVNIPGRSILKLNG